NEVALPDGVDLHVRNDLLNRRHVRQFRYAALCNHGERSQRPGSQISKSSRRVDQVELDLAAHQTGNRSGAATEWHVYHVRVRAQQEEYGLQVIQVADAGRAVVEFAWILFQQLDEVRQRLRRASRIDGDDIDGFIDLAYRGKIAALVREIC